MGAEPTAKGLTTPLTRSLTTFLTTPAEQWEQSPTPRTSLPQDRQREPQCRWE